MYRLHFKAIHPIAAATFHLKPVDLVVAPEEKACGSWGSPEWTDQLIMTRFGLEPYWYKSLGKHQVLVTSD